MCKLLIMILLIFSVQAKSLRLKDALDQSFLKVNKGIKANSNFLKRKEFLYTFEKELLKLDDKYTDNDKTYNELSSLIIAIEVASLITLNSKNCLFTLTKITSNFDPVSSKSRLTPYMKKLHRTFLNLCVPVNSNFEN